MVTILIIGCQTTKQIDTSFNIFIQSQLIQTSYDYRNVYPLTFNWVFSNNRIILNDEFVRVLKSKIEYRNKKVSYIEYTLEDNVFIIVSLESNYIYKYQIKDEEKKGSVYYLNLKYRN